MQTLTMISTDQDLLMFANEGSLLSETNYFDTKMAVDGFLFLSFNAGVWRLLVPEAQAHVLGEMATANRVEIEAELSTGKKKTRAGDAFRLWFEDGSAKPLCVKMSEGQIDRPLALKHKGSFELHVYTRAGIQMTFHAKV